MITICISRTFYGIPSWDSTGNTSLSIEPPSFFLRLPPPAAAAAALRAAGIISRLALPRSIAARVIALKLFNPSPLKTSPLSLIEP